MYLYIKTYNTLKSNEINRSLCRIQILNFQILQYHQHSALQLRLDSIDQ